MSLEVTIKDRVCTLQLNRPAQQNALNEELLNRLKMALATADTDPRVKIVVLKGTESFFCSGIDVHHLSDAQQGDLDSQLLDVGNFVELFLRVHKHKKIVIAQVEGKALSSGATLAACCDFVLASENAEMGYPDVHWGFVPATSIPMLRHRLNAGVIRNLVLSGDVHSGQKLLDIGLVNHIYPAADLEAAVIELATRLTAQSSPGSIELSKKLLADLADMGMKDALNFAARISSHSRKTVEYEIGIKAFLNKEQPEW